MAKILERDASTGGLKETLTVATSAGAASAGGIPELDSQGKIPANMMPAGIGADSTTVIASENLSAGDVVNLWNNAGALNARKADGTATGKPVDGFVNSAVASGANATVFFEGTINSLAGLTVGSRYYLSGTTAGAVTAVPVTGTGKVHQYVGKALSATVLTFEADEPILLA